MKLTFLTKSREKNGKNPAKVKELFSPVGQGRNIVANHQIKCRTSPECYNWLDNCFPLLISANMIFVPRNDIENSKTGKGKVFNGIIFLFTKSETGLCSGIFQDSKLRNVVFSEELSPSRL